mmetsp:Transcript_8063/g.31782  ORF Transcript_8063/g.31782 Transcript_8063/m.31782 type:complete len:250 (-) Transcript_8063:1551-2300(-)
MAPPPWWSRLRPPLRTWCARRRSSPPSFGRPFAAARARPRGAGQARPPPARGPTRSPARWPSGARPGWRWPAFAPSRPSWTGCGWETRTVRTRSPRWPRSRPGHARVPPRPWPRSGRAARRRRAWTAAAATPSSPRPPPLSSWLRPGTGRRGRAAPPPRHGGQMLGIPLRGSCPRGRETREALDRRRGDSTREAPMASLPTGQRQARSGPWPRSSGPGPARPTGGWEGSRGAAGETAEARSGRQRWTRS